VDLGRIEAGTAVLEQAVAQRPDSIFYRRELGAAYFSLAQQAHSYEAFDWLCRQAEAALRPAAELQHGMSTAGADLARLYLPWAAFTANSERRRWLAEQAAIYLGRQQRFAPSHPLSWLDSAVLNEFLRQPDEATRKADIAIRLADWRLDYWVETYRKSGLGCNSPELRDAYAAVVFRLYDAGLRRGGSAAEIARFRIGRAILNSGLGRFDKAWQECVEAGPLLAPDDAWQVESVMAAIEHQLKHPAEAQVHLDKALATAPPEKRKIVFEVQQEILGSRQNLAGSGETRHSL